LVCYGFPKEGDIYKLVDLVESDPLTRERLPISPTQYPGRTHVNTSLHTDGINGGHVLLPFASTQASITKQMEAYTPDTSRWCSYRFRIVGNTMLLVIENPTTRTIGTPLFLEFVNGQHTPVTVGFGNEYSISESIIIPPSKTVTGILLFGIANKWTPFSPWTCEGKPL